MAIIEALDIGVEIRVDDAALTEYPDEPFDEFNINTLGPNESIFETVPLPGTDIRGNCTQPKKVKVSKYIEATTNKQFSAIASIGKAMPFKQNATRIAVYVDGKYGDSRVVNWKYVSKNKPAIREINGRRCGTQTYAFRFAELNIVEEATTIGNESQLGTIWVGFWRINSETGGRSRRWEGIQSADANKVAEKRLKKGGAVSHGTGYSAPYASARFRTPKVTYIDGKDHPFAEFIFKFRSKKGLKALLIIPRTPLLEPQNDRSAEVRVKDEGLETKPCILRQPTERERTERSDRESDVQFLFEQTAAERLTNRRPGPNDMIVEISDDEEELGNGPPEARSQANGIDGERTTAQGREVIQISDDEDDNDDDDEPMFCS